MPSRPRFRLVLGDDDQISGLDELFRLDLDGEEFKEVLVEAHDLVPASVDVCCEPRDADQSTSMSG